jgi:hypothetical protein
LTKIGRFLAKTVRKSPRWFSKKPADLSAKPTDLSVKLTDLLVFLVFTVPPSSPLRFGRIFLIFAKFYQIFKKPTGSVTSDFRSFAEFLNIGPRC